MELKEQVSVREVVEAYQRAWRAEGTEQRRLLESSLTDDAELVQPNGRSVGLDAVIQRIAGLHDRWPGAHELPPVQRTGRVWGQGQVEEIESPGGSYHPRRSRGPYELLRGRFSARVGHAADSRRRARWAAS